MDSHISKELRRIAEAAVQRRIQSRRVLDRWLGSRLAAVLSAPDGEVVDAIRKNLVAADIGYLDNLAVQQAHLAERCRIDPDPTSQALANRLDREHEDTVSDRMVVAQIWARGSGRFPVPADASHAEPGEPDPSRFG